MSGDPFWFHRKLSIVKTKSFYGSVSYTLTVQRMEYYEYGAGY